MLEVIDKGSCNQAHPVPLLFVHGGWCWDDHFLEFFAGAGYRAVALSLRGHGNSPTTKPIRSCSIADGLTSPNGSTPGSKPAIW
jgi:pimeloyl-ACP methyl ester carboxylesterase